MILFFISQKPELALKKSYYFEYQNGELVYCANGYLIFFEILKASSDGAPQL